jgi:hypothetical protein
MHRVLYHRIITVFVSVTNVHICDAAPVRTYYSTQFTSYTYNQKTIIMLLFSDYAPHTFIANKILYYTRDIILRFSKIRYSLVTNPDDTSILKWK